MGDNNEQEAADFDAMNNDGDNLFEVIYRGGRLSNSTIYNIPANVFIRVSIYPSRRLMRMHVNILLG